MIKEKTRYWDAVAKVWYETRPQLLWRAHSDAVNILLLSHWLPAIRVERLLKTDLFDEAWGEGLYPLLSSRAKNVIGMDVSALSSNSARLRHDAVYDRHLLRRCLAWRLVRMEGNAWSLGL